MTDNVRDHYEVLGVSPSATDDEIKKAYRKMMHEHHPDKHVGVSRRQHDLARELNTAWSVLSNPEKRTLYDAERQKQTKSTTEGVFVLPENDGLNLLQGLVQAYRGPGDGMWDVRRATDANPAVPENLFVVKREGTGIDVYRRVIDWRYPWHNKPYIEVGYPAQKINANDFFHEATLAKHPSGVDVPYDYRKYLTALKNLAAKIAYGKKNVNGNYDVAKEFRIIDTFLRCNARYAREGASNILATESTRSIPNKDFLSELSLAEDLVSRREMPQTGKEGQTRAPEQQRPTGGENLG